MPKIQAHGFAADAPAGWDAQIYVRPPLGAADLMQTSGTPEGQGDVEDTRPIVHLANFPLASDRADFGGGAVEAMESGGVFIALIEHDPAVAGTGLFANATPWPLRPDDFAPEQMQRTLPGQAGCQRFFSAQGRAFCLYIAIGSHRNRVMLAKVVNDALAKVQIE
jgi:hypothetical protein